MSWAPDFFKKGAKPSNPSSMQKSIAPFYQNHNEEPKELVGQKERELLSYVWANRIDIPSYTPTGNTLFAVPLNPIFRSKCGPEGGKILAALVGMLIKKNDVIPGSSISYNTAGNLLNISITGHVDKKMIRETVASIEKVFAEYKQERGR